LNAQTPVPFYGLDPLLSDVALSSSFNIDALLSQPDSERLRKELRTENFYDERLLRFVRGCNNGGGLPEKNQDALFAMFNKGFNPQNLHVRSARQLKKYEVENLHLEKDVSHLSTILLKRSALGVRSNT
jgi:hypothetical protein